MRSAAKVYLSQTQDVRKQHERKVAQVNLKLSEERFYMKALGVCTVFIGLILLLASGFRSPTRGNPQGASSTRTALARTEQALLGPFPTATGPTPTTTLTARPTFTSTLTPSPTSTRTPVRYFINTATPRTPISNSNTALPSLPIAETPVPASQPTNPPPVQPTDQPTEPPAPTDPPPLPPEPTQENKPCVNPQGHPIPCPGNA